MDAERLLSWMAKRGAQLTVVADQVGRRRVNVQLDFNKGLGRQEMHIPLEKFDRDKRSDPPIPTLTDAVERLIERVQCEELD